MKHQTTSLPASLFRDILSKGMIMLANRKSVFQTASTSCVYESFTKISQQNMICKQITSTKVPNHSKGKNSVSLNAFVGADCRRSRMQRKITRNDADNVRGAKGEAFCNR